MNEELIYFLATVYGEAANQSESAWKAVAYTIMNRFDFREWKKYTNLIDLIKNDFDAATDQNIPFLKARHYFVLRGEIQPIARLERLYYVVFPIYEKKDVSKDRIVMYYSPKAQEFLHDKDPKKYTRIKPKWAESPLVKEVKMPGCEQDDFSFFMYV